MKFKYLSILFIAVYMFSCKGEDVELNKLLEDNSAQATSLIGKELFSPKPSDELLNKFIQKRENYKKDPTAENLIWYGRFMAYMGKYREAIDLFSKGVEEFPEDARFLRHRGHRYITIREFDKAIEDYSNAVRLIAGKENEIEPDGMPNARNIPVSTLHGNIFYHLGLAKYLKQDFKGSLAAFKQCLSLSSKPDNQVSSTHWIYMNLRRLGDEEEAEKYAENIAQHMDVIENDSYYELCLFYRGMGSINELADLEDDSSGSDAIQYGMGNWFLYNGRHDHAKSVFMDLIKKDSWNSFGYIAAEAEIAKIMSENDKS